jgi:hypothetical protein
MIAAQVCRCCCDGRADTRPSFPHLQPDLPRRARGSEHGLRAWDPRRGGDDSRIHPARDSPIGGWDHLLFIIAVVFLAGQGLRAAKLVSLFVLGHSLTLLSLNAEVVDVVRRRQAE